jgi:hypothetical protein
VPALRLLDIFIDQFNTIESANQPKQNSYELCDPILLRDLTDPNPKHLDELVSFLYYHGWLTIERETPESKFIFRIPNLLTWPLFINSLIDHVGVRNEKIRHFIDNPSESGLEELFNPMLDHLEASQWTNRVGENILGVLFSLLLKGNVSSTHQAEFRVIKTESKEDGTKDEGYGYVDMWIESLLSNNAVMIEFKRIRPNAIILPTESKPHNSQPEWAREEYVNLFNQLDQLSEEKLRLLKIAKRYQFNNCSTVGDVEKAAIKQVKTYNTPPDFANKKVSRFTVIQVGRPLLIKSVN